MSTTTSDDLVSQINAQAPSLEVAEAMLLGTAFESRQDSNALEYSDSGSGGHGGVGAYQITTPNSWNITVAQAEDPAVSTSELLPSYLSATNVVNELDPSLFQTNPQQASEEIASLAERPAGYQGSDPTGSASLNAEANDQPSILNGTMLAPSGETWWETVLGETGNYNPNLTGRTGAGISSSTGSTSSGSSGSYQPAANYIGRFCQQIDGFLNPTVTIVPNWVNLMSGILTDPLGTVVNEVSGKSTTSDSSINGIAGTIATLITRGMMVAIGLSSLIVGMVVISGKSGKIGSLASGAVGGLLAGPEGAAIGVSSTLAAEQERSQRAAQQAQAKLDLASTQALHKSRHIEQQAQSRIDIENAKAAVKTTPKYSATVEAERERTRRKQTPSAAQAARDARRRK